MAWVAAIVIVRLVATLTSVGCVVVITVDVAKGTFVFDGLVCARERVYDVVVKISRYPRRFSMTGLTIGRELCGLMVRVSRLIKIALVTTDASIRRIVIITIVARFTIIGNSSMGTVERVVIIVIFKTCGLPILLSRMTRSTVGRQG